MRSRKIVGIACLALAVVVSGRTVSSGRSRSRMLPTIRKAKSDSYPAAVTFAATLPALLVAHNVADHWLQTSHQADTKGERSHQGRMACLSHVASYTALTAMTVALLRKVFGLPISPLGFVIGQLISAATHYWADRRFTLAALAESTGKGKFYRLGAPRDGRDDNPSLGTGSYALDQSWHWLWLFVAALFIAVV